MRVGGAAMVRKNKVPQLGPILKVEGLLVAPELTRLHTKSDPYVGSTQNKPVATTDKYHTNNTNEQHTTNNKQQTTTPLLAS